ncbi:hypothetical protein RI367_004308 [Sorochytrium milnesiophthora]
MVGAAIWTAAYAVVALLTLSVAGQSASTTLYVDSSATASSARVVTPRGSGSPTDGTNSPAFATLTQAWDYINTQQLPAGTTVNIILAPGNYYYPKQPYTLPAGYHIRHIASDAASAGPGVTPDVVVGPTSLGQGEQAPNAPLLTVSSNTSVEWTFVTFSGFSLASTSSSSQWEVAHVQNTAAWTMTNCLITELGGFQGGGVSQPAFVMTTHDTSALSMVNVSVTSTYVQFSLADASQGLLTGLNFYQTCMWQQALFITTSSATLQIQGSSFAGTVGMLVAASASSQLTLSSTSITTHSCDLSTCSVGSTTSLPSGSGSSGTTVPFGIATANNNARLSIVGSQLSQIQADTCTSGLIGMYDTSIGQLSALSVTNVNARLLYCDGSSRTTLANSQLTNLNEVPSVGYIISATTSAAVVIANSTMTGNVGSYIFLASSSLTIQNTTMVNTICPPSRSYLITLLGSTSLQISQTLISNTQTTIDPVSKGALTLPSKACSIADAADNVHVSLTDISVTGFYCRASCFSTQVNAQYTVTRATLTGNVLSDYGYGLFNLQNGQRITHTFTNVTLQGNIGAVVTGLPYGIYAVQSALQIAGFTGTGNSLLSVLYVDPTSTALVSRSTFQDNMFQGHTTSPSVGAAIMAVGSTQIAASTFSGNYAKRGGAVAFSVPNAGAPGNYFGVSSSTFLSNQAATDGGAIYVAGITQAAQVNVTGTTFNANIAKRGGAWYTASGTQGITDNANTYNGNTASDQGNNFASFFNHLELAPSSAGLNTSTISVVTGGTINATISVIAKDLFGQPYVFGGVDTVLLAGMSLASPTGATVPSAMLTGETVKAVFTGQSQFQSVQVYGPPGQYTLAIAKLVDLNVMDTANVSFPLTINPCQAPSHIEPSSAFGPNYQSCVPAYNNCTCYSQAYEGIACQLKVGIADSVVLRFPASLYANTVGTRDALINRLSTILAPSYSLVFNSLQLTTTPVGSASALNATPPSVSGPLRRRSAAALQNTQPLLESQNLDFKFSVIQASTGQYVEAGDLDALRTSLLSALPNSSYAEQGQSDPYMFFWPPPTSSMSVLLYQVDKQAVYETQPIGGALLGVTILLICATIAMTGALVVQRQHPVVQNANVWFLVLMAIGMVGMYITAMTFLGIPTPLKCATQPAFGFTAIGYVLSVLFARAVHSYMVCENPIICKGALPTSYLSRYVIAIGTNVAIIGALSLGFTVVANPVPAVFTSDTTGPYWTCVSQNTVPVMVLRLAIAAMLILTFFGGCRIAWKARRALSLSNEPRFLVLIYWNSLVCAIVQLGISYGIKTLSVQVQFIIMCIIIISLVGLWSATWLGYKLYVIYVKAERSAGQPMIIQGKKPSQPDEADLLGQVEESAGVASGLLAVRNVSMFSSRWKAGFVEVATQYGYLALTCGNEANDQATYYPLPCTLKRVKSPEFCLLLDFKNGHQLLLQCKSEENVAEWTNLIQKAGQNARSRRASELDANQRRKSSMSSALLGNRKTIRTQEIKEDPETRPRKISVREDADIPTDDNDNDNQAI